MAIKRPKPQEIVVKLRRVEVLMGLSEALSCVDGSFYARVNLSDFDVCRLRSCARPFDAVDNTAGYCQIKLT